MIDKYKCKLGNCGRPDKEYTSCCGYCGSATTCNKICSKCNVSGITVYYSTEKANERTNNCPLRYKV